MQAFDCNDKRHGNDSGSGRLTRISSINSNKLFVNNGNENDNVFGTLSVTGEKLRLLNWRALHGNNDGRRAWTRQYYTCGINLQSRKRAANRSAAKADEDVEKEIGKVEESLDELLTIKDSDAASKLDLLCEADHLIVKDKATVRKLEREREASKEAKHRRRSTATTNGPFKRDATRSICRLATSDYVNRDACGSHLKDIYESVEVADFRRILDRFRSIDGNDNRRRRQRSDNAINANRPLVARPDKPICIDASAIYHEHFGMYRDQFDDICVRYDNNRSHGLDC